ncbi:MAG: TlpA family protein disulfide reductase [Bacteroides sp.]|nr:TlpA family protein disulfide reductase [Bacteroides sp.]
MKKIMTVAVFVAALASCQSNGKKSEDTVVESKPVVVEAGTHEPDSVGYIVRVGDMAPEFEMELTDGQKVKLSALRGKVVMLQFTASWCGVCRKEMPFIEKDIWLKHKSNPNFALYGVDRDEPLATVKAFAEKTGVTYPLGLDPGADIFAKYADRKAGITRNVLVDKTGKIVMLTRLYNEEEFASLCKKIDEMLAE